MFSLRQNVIRSHRRAQRAGRRIAHCGVTIGAASRTGRNRTIRIQLDIRRQVIWEVNRCSRCLALFQRELLRRRVNLAEVVDAGIGLRCGAGFHKVRNRDRRQQADNGHNDHDFNQRETSLTEFLGHFHFMSKYGVNLTASGL